MISTWLISKGCKAMYDWLTSPVILQLSIIRPPQGEGAMGQMRQSVISSIYFADNDARYKILENLTPKGKISRCAKVAVRVK